MKATIYKYGSNIHGFYVQRINASEVINNVTKKQLIEMSDLRHPIHTKMEFYDILSTDMNGNKKQSFELLGKMFLILVEI